MSFDLPDTPPGAPPPEGSSSSEHEVESRPSLERLRALLLAEGGLMGGLVAKPTAEEVVERQGSTERLSPSSTARPGPAQIAASGPRVDGRRAAYELLVDTIYEGYLLHYRVSRVVRASDRDLGLLAGDRLYALGLANLVELGDVEAVGELADVITLSALAQGSGDPQLADSVWMAGARAVGWGARPEHARAKALTRAGSPEALAAMRALEG